MNSADNAITKASPYTQVPDAGMFRALLTGEKKASEIESQWPEATPLVAEIEKSDEFPVDALGPIIGDAAKICHKNIQAPLAVCALSFLAVANLTVQGMADLVIDGKERLLSLMFISVAESGERKSAVDAIAVEPVRIKERTAIHEYEQQAGEYKIEAEVYESAKKEILSQKKKTPAEKVQLIKDLGPEPLKPLQPTRLLSDVTTEGLVRHLMDGVGVCGLFSDEGGKIVSGYSMSEQNQLAFAATLSDLIDTGNASKQRATGGNLRVAGKRVCGHLMMQPGVARKLYLNDDLKDQGFLSRTLVAYPENVPNKIYVDADTSNDAAVKRFKDKALINLNQPLIVRAGSRNEVEARRIQLTPEAKTKYMDFHNSVQRRITSGELAIAKGVANKAHDQAARLAATLALFANHETNEVDENAMDCGIKLMEYFLSQSVRLFNAAPVDKALADAEELLKWLRKDGRREVETREIYHTGPNRMRPEKVAKSLLAVLHRHGYVRLIPDRKKETWEIRPEATE